MGSKISPNPQCWQSFRLKTSNSLCHSWNPTRVIPFWSLRNLSNCKVALSHRLAHGSSFCGSRNLKLQRIERACSAHLDETCDEIMMDLIQEVAKKFNEFEDEDDGDETGKKSAYEVSERTKNSQVEKSSESGSNEQFWTMKPEPLEPALLGIQLEPPNWPEREKILMLNFQRRASTSDIPLSMRMIQKRLKLETNLKEASELTYCSVKKIFSSMLFIIHELQNYALQIRESLYCEDLQGVMANLRREVDASFVWLFQQIFCKTPSLMVYVMVLLANFSVFSMTNNTVIAAVTPPSMITEVRSLTDNNNAQYAEVDVDHDEYKNKQLTEEVTWWNSMLSEALKTQVLDHKAMKQFVAPVSEKTDGDGCAEYARTVLYYKMNLSLSPNNSLLLSNYAQFLYLVLHDLNQAEEYFRLSVLSEPQDAEAYSRYADFLWLAKNDLWEAEFRYLQALDADPGNSHHASKYACFLWSTGGEDTCFPLDIYDN